MNTKITHYNLFETTSSVDLWQLRNLFIDEINKSKHKKTSFNFSSKKNKNLRTNIEALLSIEVNGWDMHRPPSIKARKKFIGQLFNYGFPLNIVYGGAHSLLKQAVDSDDLKMFEYLIQCCEIDVDIESNRESEFLLEQILASKNQSRFIHVFLKINNPKIISIHLNAKDVSETTSLMRAAKNNQVVLLESLMIAGASLEEVNADGETAVLIAALDCHLDAVKLLIKYGANVKASSNYGLSLCSIAYEDEKDAPELLHYLMEHKIDAIFDDLHGVPILMNAIKEKYSLSTIKRLLTKERVNQPCSETGNTPLITVYLNGYDEFNYELIELLLSHGAHPSLGNKKNQTAISIVKQWYNDLDEDKAQNYDDAIESQVNVLAFKSYELYIAEDAILKNEPENYDAKIKLKSLALDVLKNIEDYILKDYEKAQKEIAVLQFGICDIYLIKFVQGIDDDFEFVITQFEWFDTSNMDNYKKAQFEIASFLINLAANTTNNSEQRRGFLIRALQHADHAQDKTLSNEILNSLCGKTITDELTLLPINNYARLSYFSEVVKDNAKEISALKQQLAALKPSSSSSSLLGKRLASSIFSEGQDDELYVAPLAPSKKY
jgi:ankyrin repeat protein